MNVQALAKNQAMRMTSVEIANLVDSRHDSVKRTIERLSLDCVISLPPMEEVKVQRERRAESVGAYIFEGEKGKRDSIVVVAQLSPEFTARLVDRWQELESMKHQPIEQPKATHGNIELDLRCLDIIGNSLRVSDSGRLGMVSKYCEHYAPQLLVALPTYAVDAPLIANTQSESSEPTTTITKITAGVMRPQRANARLAVLGLIEHLSRKDSRGLDKFFWSVTEKGLEYGKNVTHPNNPRETQPHWYVSKANDLLALLLSTESAK